MPGGVAPRTACRGPSAPLVSVPGKAEVEGREELPVETGDRGLRAGVQEGVMGDQADEDGKGERGVEPGFLDPGDDFLYPAGGAELVVEQAGQLVESAS